MQATRRGWFHELCGTQVDRVWRAIHGQPAPRGVESVVDLLVPAGLERTLWPSHISDDHTPYEISLLLGGSTPEVRLMAEPLPAGAPCPTLADTVNAGLRLRPALEALGADFSRFDRVADLFLPSHPTGAFALWYAASFAPDGTPSFKVYFNPAVGGAHEAPRLVEEALARLGVDGGWATVSHAMPRGPELDELRFFSLDLVEGARARVKVYGFHHRATTDDLLRVIASVPSADCAAVRRYCGALLGGDGAIVAARQPATCLAK